METQEWFEQFTARKIEEGVREGVREGLRKAKESWQLETMGRLCRKRLGRLLNEIENAALADRLGGGG